MKQASYYTYRNLWKGGFSTKRRGVVCDRFQEGMILEAKFRVSDAGNQRARDEGTRNVHAYVVSDEPAVPVDKWPENLIEVTYNPFKYKGFTTRDGRLVLYAPRVYFSNGKAYVFAYS